MPNLRRWIAVALCLVLFHSTSQAWGSFGHMAVAWVAYQKLTPAKQARVIALLKKNPYYKTKWLPMIPAGTSADQQNLMIFMIAATWPDAIKSDKSYTSDGDTPPTNPTAWSNTGYSDMKMHKYWHFIDMPFTQDSTAPLPAIPTTNAETEIAIARQTLTSTAKDTLKSYDLVWLMHLVGDVHQPLHATTRVSTVDPKGDIGGNDVKVTNPSDELHGFWDNLPGTGTDLTKVIAYAQTLAAADPDLAKKTDAADWINESFTLASTQVYLDPIGAGNGPFALTDAYKSNAQTIANQRVELAGERLANVINNELQ